MRAKDVVIGQLQGHAPVQEDCMLAERERGIFVVADGFGGQRGAEASKTACEGIREFLEREAGDEDATLPFVLRSYYSLAGNVLFNAVLHANKKVMGLNKTRGVNDRGGSSAIAGYVDGDLLALANVGACSVLLFRQGRWIELVLPRTYARLNDPFAVTSAGLRIPLSALGLSEDLEPEIVEVRLQAGDWLLFHTSDLPLEFLRQTALAQSEGRGPEGAQIALQGDSAIVENLSYSLVIF